ncbi:MAG: hypothetical protein K2L07_14290 [Lachnospiraceae bacterium]|nr:hypothetical protein [Lachnospiraceae bacterium]
MKIREFLRLRKLNDTVKIMCIFALAGAGFFINVLYNAEKLYHDMQSPVEYQLVRGNTVTNAQLSELAQIEDVAAASRSLDVPITIRYRNQEATMICTMLSKSYMETAYGILISGSEKKFYVNETAFEEIQAGFLRNNVSFEKEGTTEHGAEYKIQYLEEEAGTEEENMPQTISHSAWLVILEEKPEQEAALICTVEEGAKLSKKANSVRVLFAGHDLDGLRLTNLKKMGYEVQNEQVLAMEEYEMKIRLHHIQYGILICAICLVALYYMKKNVPELVGLRTDRSICA